LSKSSPPTRRSERRTLCRKNSMSDVSVDPRCHP
jgi:hypothetical protein